MELAWWFWFAVIAIGPFWLVAMIDGMYRVIRALWRLIREA